MTDFVREDADQFFGGLAFDQGVVESDFLKFAEAGEVGVGFGRAFGAIDDEEADEGEIAFLGHGLDGGFEFAVFHGSEFIEEGQDEARSEESEEEGEDCDGKPSVNPSVGESSEEPEDKGDEGDA